MGGGECSWSGGWSVVGVSGGRGRGVSHVGRSALRAAEGNHGLELYWIQSYHVPVFLSSLHMNVCIKLVQVWEKNKGKKSKATKKKKSGMTFKTKKKPAAGANHTAASVSLGSSLI